MSQAIESILGIKHINEPHEECILLQKKLDAPVHGKIHLHDVQSERCVAWVVDLNVLMILNLPETASSHLPGNHPKRESSSSNHPLSGDM